MNNRGFGTLERIIMLIVLILLVLLFRKQFVAVISELLTAAANS